MPATQKPTGPRPEAQFKIMSGALKAFTRKDAEGNEKRYISCTASSSIKDLHEDEFTPECVNKMSASAIQKGMTIFLNHQYAVPEDVFGSTTSATSVVRQGADGMPVTDMDLEVVLNETNPRAVSTFEALDSGVKLGVSIGALIKAWHPRDPNDTWGWDGMVIEDVELLEASIVGIPANPRSWVKSAVKSLREAVRAQAEEEPDETSQLVQMISDGVSIVKSDDLDTDEVIDPAPITDDENAGDPEEALEGETVEEVEKQAEPTEQPPSDGAASAEATGVSETTTSAPSPDSANSEATLKGLDVLIDGYKAKIATLQSQNTQLKTERDQALDALKTATEIVDKIASLPIGRKTSFAAGVSDFKEKFGGVYDNDFLQFLERKPE